MAGHTATAASKADTWGALISGNLRTSLDEGNVCISAVTKTADFMGGCNRMMSGTTLVFSPHETTNG